MGIYNEAIPFLLNTPEEVRSPRGQKVHEIIGAHIEIYDPRFCIWTGADNTRPYPLQYLKDELCAYLACTNDLKDFANISKFWSQLSDDDETINSAYGEIVYDKKHTNKLYNSIKGELKSGWEQQCSWRDMVFTQFDWVIESFKKDKDTRQAIMFVASPYYQYEGNKDFICTLNYHFIIDSANRLKMIVNRRSQDIHFGMTFDIPWECVLQMIVLHEVQKIYPDVTLGSYQLNCNSLHMYERNFATYDGFVDDSKYAEHIPNIKDNYFKHPVIMSKVSGKDVTYEGDDEFLTWLIN